MDELHRDEREEEKWRVKIWHVWWGKETFEVDRRVEVRPERVVDMVPDTQDLSVNICWKN